MGGEKENLILDKSYNFAVMIVDLCGKFPKTPAGYAIASQLIRSGTSVGANSVEAQSALSRADFVKCMNIALKEARESDYWLRLVRKCGYANKPTVDSSLDECASLIKILMRIVKSSRNN